MQQGHHGFHGFHLVGLTGNIASGKSEVARRLAAKGATLIDADVLAREAVAPGTPGLAAIRARWGEGVLTKDGALDRAALRRIVFRDAVERKALDAIVHPEVARLRAAAVARARAAGAAVVVLDIPLLFEIGLENTVETIVLVDAPIAVRRDRLIHDRHLVPEEADAMMAAQIPSEDKRARAHHIVENDGDLTALDLQVERLWRELTRTAQPGSA